MARWYYKQWCDLFDRVWANDAKMVSVYVYLHCHAYVQPKKWHGLLIRRGSCPTSRSAIMEATGLSEQEVKSRLKKLASYGEIVIKTTNHGNIVTICDYDVYGETEDIFDAVATSQQPTQKPANNPPRNQPIYNRVNSEDNIISPISPYNEREKKAVVREIQKKYNTMFKGILPPYTRLYLGTQLKVEECIRNFGLQSVDEVLEQVKREPFSLGKNRTGFQANFQYIFTPSEFQKYFERAQLARQKREQTIAQQEEPHSAEKPCTGSWQDAYLENNHWRPEEKK